MSPRPAIGRSRLAAALAALGLALATAPARAEVDLNSADAEQLETLPGIGAARARRIVDWRAAHGPFSSVDDLRLVGGFAEATLERLRPLVVVRAPKEGGGARHGGAKAPARPPAARPAAAAPAPGPLDQEPPEGKVNLNLATLEELQTLPGITEANARIIAAWRTRRGPFRTVNELARVPGLPPTIFATVQYFVTTRTDPNTATAVQLVALGASEAGAQTLVEACKRKKLRSADELDAIRSLSDKDREALRPLLWFPPRR